MKLTGNRIDAFIRQPPADLIGVLVFGPDGGLVAERAKAMAAKLCDDVDDPFATTRLNTDDLSADSAKLSDEMSAMSLLGGGRLIRLRLDHERHGAAISKLIKELDRNPARAEARLVVEAGDVKPKSAIRKAFEASAHFASIACYPDNARDTAALVRAALEEKDMSVKADALGIWVPMLEGDRSRVRSEVDKMILFKGDGRVPGAVVTIGDVRAIASESGDASFQDIVFSTFSGRVAEADAAYRRAVAGKTNPIGILRGLQNHMTRLMGAALAMEGGGSPESAIRSLRPPVFGSSVGVMVRHLELWPRQRISDAIHQALQVEIAAKTAQAPVDALVSRLILALSAYAAKRT